MLGRTHDDTLDAGPRNSAPGTERFCAATHQVKPIDEMIRFVVAPDGTAVPDLKRRLPPRHLDHGDAPSARHRDRPQGVCPQLQA
jgi:hypothetical protein